MQRYVILGLSHKFAPLEVRERLAYSDRRIPAALRAMREQCGCEEVAILSTCNRVEITAFTSDPDAPQRILAQLAADHAFTPEYLQKYCYVHRGADAVQHLLRVAGGLDSLVLGETQVLNQVKRAYLLAQSENTTGKSLNTLFHKAFQVAKRLHTETDIGRGQLSISSVAVSYVDRVFEDLRSKTALLIGAGEVGELTLTYLRERGIGRVLVVSRTLERARDVAQRFSGDAVPFELIEDYLPAADIVVCQTSSETPLLGKTSFARSQKKRGFAPVFALDLAVPRDITADAASVDGVFLYNVDDLEAVVAEHTTARSQELEVCAAIIREEAQKFSAGFSASAAGPLIAALRERAQSVKQAELERLAPVLENLPEDARQEVHEFADRLINKLLHPHILALKDEIAAADPAQVQQAIRLLGLNHAPLPKTAPAPRPATEPKP